MLEILIELNDRKQKFELYFLTDYYYNHRDDTTEGCGEFTLQKLINNSSIDWESNFHGKSLTLIYSFTFKHEEWKRKKYNMERLNEILNHYRFYLYNAARDFRSDGYTIRHLNYENEIILKVLKSPRMTDTSVSGIINDDLIQNLNGKTLFDRVSYRWYILKNDIWIKMDYYEFKEYILNILKEYEVFKDNMTKSFLDKILIDLKKRYITKISDRD